MKAAVKLSLIILFVFSGLVISAQSNQMQTTKAEYNDRQVDALSIDIRPSRKEVQKAFSDWMKERYDVKMKGGGLFGDKNLEESEAVVIPTISPDNISIITQTNEMNGMTQMTLFASRGLGNFVDRSREDAFMGLEKLFDAFLSDYLPEYYDQRVTEAEKALADLEKEYEGVERDIEKNQSDMQELRKDNEKLRANLDAIRSQLRKAQNELRARRSNRAQAPAKIGNNSGG
jgi:predicted ribosome quality control (RQC) complex YloA/Tae2 family protein